MLILIPFDGSENSLRAVQYAAKTSQKSPSLEFDLLHVFDPVPVRAHAALTQDEIRLLHAEDTNLIFEPAQRILDHASSKYTTHYRFGNPASEIAAHVIEKGCDAVIMAREAMG